MEIKIKLMGMLAGQTPQDGKLQLPDDATIENALIAVDVPVERIAAFSVNGSLFNDRQHVLASVDELTVLPPVGGG